MKLVQLSTDRSEQQKAVEIQLAESVKEAVAEGATGYVLIYTTKDDIGAVVNVFPQSVREVLGFIELDVKPLLAERVYE